MRLLADLLCKGVNELLLLIFSLQVGRDSARSEVADEELKQVEADEVGGDIVGSGPDDVDVGRYEKASSGPSQLTEADELVDEGVVESAYLSDALCC